MAQNSFAGEGGSAPRKNAADIPYTPEWYARQAKAYSGRTDQSARRPVIATPPPSRAPSKPRTYYSNRSSATHTVSAHRATNSGGGGGARKAAPAGPSYQDGYNKAMKEVNDRKSNDSPQVAALKKMLSSSFESARNTKVGNIRLLLGQQDAVLLGDYKKRAASLEGNRSDNDKSEVDASTTNLANRARERGDIMLQASSQGAGESDTLRASLQAVRNWSANQQDVNRSFFDTQRSVNGSIVDLNSDTRTARSNLYGAALSDTEQVWANYYNQRADAYTQLGNIQASKTSDSYLKNSGSFNSAAKEAASSWKSPGIPKAVRDWAGTTKTSDRTLNNSDPTFAATVGTPRKKPEGATLRKW